MPFPFDKYPWLNFQELNLAYFIKHFREIFEQWNTLLNEMYDWKDATDAELAEWKSTVEAGISSWETGLQQSMEDWKDETEADISAWESATLAALDAWKTATTAVFEAIRTEAAASATAASESMAGAQAAQAAAEAAAEYIEDSAVLISEHERRLNEMLGTEEIVISDLSGYTRYIGTISSDNEWNNVANSNYQYVIIPINGANGRLTATYSAQNGTYYLAGLKTYTPPSNGDIPDFSDTGASAGNPDWTKRITISQSYQYTNVAIPSDVNYIVAVIVSGGTEHLPASFNITIPASDGTIQDIEASIAALVSSASDMQEDISDNTININDNYTGDERYVYYDDIIGYVGRIIPGKRYNTQGIIGDNENAAIIEKFTAKADILFSRIPSGITFERKIVFDGDTVTAVYGTGNPIYNTEEYYTVKKGETVGFSLFKSNTVVTKDYVLSNIGAKIKSDIYWVAFGDSITEGVYTYKDENDVVHSATSNEKSYCQTIKNITGWNLDNKGQGGSGWLMRSPNEQENIIDAITAVGDNFTKYNLCTIALGVNDWKGDQTFGTLADTTLNSTVYANMKYTIEYILAHNPNINIVIITPLNCAVYQASTEVDNWGIGYPNSNGKTLEDMFDLIVDVCDYYGIKYIDNTHYSTVNRKNIKQILLDNVHPSEEGHRLIGQRLAGEI